jgi:hypothetical protein
MKAAYGLIGNYIVRFTNYFKDGNTEQYVTSSHLYRVTDDILSNYMITEEVCNRLIKQRDLIQVW